jgi:hypothetical protein
MSALAASVQTISNVAVGTAVGGAGVGFLLGWSGRGWLYAENDERAAQTRLKNAKRTMWGSRKAMVVGVLVLWATALAYIYGQGR